MPLSYLSIKNGILNLSIINIINNSINLIIST